MQLRDITYKVTRSHYSPHFCEVNNIYAPHLHKKEVQSLGLHLF